MSMNRRGYTPIEFAVTALVALALLALLIPAVVGSREESRMSQCQSNLRQMGVGLLIHADRDPYTRYCTGASDWYRDGCPDSVGWVADLVNMQYVRPIDLLCPSNPLAGNEVLAEACSRDYALTEDDGRDDPAYWHQEKFAASGICGDAAAWGVGSTPVRIAAVERYLLDKGYGTNYSASWYLVRGGPKLTVAKCPSDPHGSRETISTPTLQGRSQWKALANTLGPLRLRDVDKSYHPSSSLPLLGDGGPAGVNLRAPADLRHDGKPLLHQGDQLAQSYNPGPATYNGTAIVPLAGEVLVGQIVHNGTEFPTWSGQVGVEARSAAQGTTALQDTRGWLCHHRGAANLLFADGSVREYCDLNGDGLLNPGFPVALAPTAGRSAAEASADPVGYRDQRVELPQTEVFSGLFLRNVGQHHRPPTCNPDSQ
jgi:prepilin-type processing-associated H-X9-DG protein